MSPGLAYLCEGLREQRRGLVTLVLWNNQVTQAGTAYLGVTLPHAQSLETLNLGHNPIGNEGVRNLKTGLIGNRSVLRLGLASTKLTCEGGGARSPTEPLGEGGSLGRGDPHGGIPQKTPSLGSRAVTAEPGPRGGRLWDPLGDPAEAMSSRSKG
ncbi:protein phosphatase 1 regulatory subunit 37-like [Meleagris gallopavo]|uniref:protein phosphatase 1 regulatory subunit 37-like n=1 Tax=Meleagris gallopavo TaxID=9103 RepID=UPI00093D32E4|nr:protein phosphatase 1 regulatory subunit 37-like [Meleagris gallopavo]